jgi:hypothetical protein
MACFTDVAAESKTRVGGPEKSSLAATSLTVAAKADSKRRQLQLHPENDAKSRVAKHACVTDSTESRSRAKAVLN